MLFRSINSSRLGFRGTEDLGGGMSAGFWLEGQLSNDDGNAAGLNFQRRSTVSVTSGFGEVRIGRDYTPTFWNTTVYDPFGTNGVGQSMTPGMLGSVLNNNGVADAGKNAIANSTNAVRANNSIGYFTPNISGFTGQVMVVLGENAGAAKTNNYTGFRASYGAGPISAAYAWGKTKGATGVADVTYTNFGASYDLGVAKPIFTWAQEKSGAGLKVTGMLFGATAPLGAGELRVAYSRYDVASSNNDWNKFAVGYVHNLSKRTALYTTYARVSNKGTSTTGVANNGLGGQAFGAATSLRASAGGNASGYEFGVRHSF